ncbi:helix-turn-helix domain-containing protein [Sporosarcina highlanderae]|uniref:Helix-turn-helix domain-containing protein n=1 Tax=Sporosarcina highlanderae TaxID=3035916 RepID=A0ABT8JX12_9BACL|nr:helix-turn-helix domain-containing protein [Sporosarcina highlanderae]MDN4609106.1 helix-turn-helix domain-containing protein [Sporosarcina highlanderae]
MNVLDQIISVQEAAELWGLSPDHVKRLCRDGDIIAKKVGNSWVVLKDQDNPKQRERKTSGSERIGIKGE